MSKRNRLFTCFLIASLLLSACQPIQPVGRDSASTNAQIVRYAAGQGMANIDPAIGEDYSVNHALISLYDALFIVHDDKMENNLVESYQASPDASEFTFKLKANAKFHDGSPVNADAVVYSWQRMIRLQGAPTYRWDAVADQNSIRKVDEFTVKFRLLQPFAPFLSTLAHFYIVNPAIVEANKGDDDGQSYLKNHEAGSGPFVLGQWEEGKRYEFITYRDYWGGWPNGNPIDGFEWLVMPDSDTQYKALLAGEIHVAELIYTQQANTIRTMPGLRVVDTLSIAINGIKMNTQSHYLSDPNLRKAIAYAFNYAELPKAFDGPLTLMTGPTPPDFPGEVSDLDAPSYDLAKAKAYLQQTAWPDGGITLDYVYIPQVIEEEAMGKLLRDGLQQLNITLNLKPQQWEEIVASCSSPESAPDLVNIYTVPAYLDPDANLYNQYHSSQWGSYASCNFYKNERVDQLLSEGRSSVDPNQRLALYQEANRLIAADQPAIWTYKASGFFAMNDCLKNHHSSPPDNVLVLFQDLTMEGCPLGTSTGITQTTEITATSTVTPHVTIGMTGAEKRAMAKPKEFAFYELPDMDRVGVANIAYKDNLTLDLYYPPAFDFSQPLPVVVFVHGVSDYATLKDTGWYVSWGQLAAASGMVGINYDVRVPHQDIISLLNYLHENGSFLGIDPSRICLWASSGNPAAGILAMTRQTEPYHAGLQCAVIYYGSVMKLNGEFPKNFSILGVRAGKDYPGFSDHITDLTDWATEQGAEITFIDYPEGTHSFDVTMDTPRTREIIGQTLEFLKEQLQVEQ